MIADCSVAVTNAGEYVFLLKKGARYDLLASSDIAWDFTYSAVDDVPAAPMRGLKRLRSMRGDSDDGRWVDEPGTFELTFSGSECAVSLGGGAISSGYTWDAAANVSGVLVVQPTNVSFRGRIDVAELAAVSDDAVGYFANPSLARMLDHGLNGAKQWIRVSDYNYAGGDQVTFGACYSPFSPTFHVRIKKGQIS